ncbi:hypothetical protein PtA15_7A585 [Puccinia triticina]|uniref:Uncharacterized protein n=1 Tax=Puccinia triticina TaxID=208348 RepID=A0ABY7CNN2_9BASI|nr:uncharacterized protein PtA15_7A585 [Puccinia triticina]WAQ86856.1 hypothetical protein PtA15_7A585 [Puccinia triticina]
MADRRKELHSIDHPTTRPAPGKWLRSGYAVPHGADGCTRAVNGHAPGKAVVDVVDLCTSGDEI